MLQRLRPENEGGLREYLVRDEQRTVLMLGNLRAVGMRPNPLLLRAGEYFGWYADGALQGVMALMNDGACYVHAVDQAAAAPMAVLLKDRSIRVMQGAPQKFVRAVHKNLRREHVFESAAHIYTLPDPGECDRPAGLELDYVGAQDTEALRAVTRIYNEAQDEAYSMERIVQSAREIQDGECLMLGKWDGTACLTARINARTHAYRHIGALGVMPFARGHGFAVAANAALARRALKEGGTPLVIVGDANEAALRCYNKLHARRGGDYGFYWYK